MTFPLTGTIVFAHLLINSREEKCVVATVQVQYQPANPVTDADEYFVIERIYIDDEEREMPIDEAAYFEDRTVEDIRAQIYASLLADLESRRSMNKNR